MSELWKKLPILRGVRERARRRFFRLLAQVASVEDTRDLFNGLLREQNGGVRPPELASLTRILPPPYADLPESQPAETRLRRDIIFVTGRFRSGSTLLWNVFRSISGTTSYYEPFNERRWFDLAARGGHVDSTHRGVSDYGSEYDGLGELGRYFDDSWKFRHLYMPADAWNPRMQRYIEVMIERAAGRPVLQFNEVDFRLPWLKARFPNARIMHIYRHPRDQWCSTLRGEQGPPESLTLRGFDDHFYLLPWARDLKHAFPVLNLADEAHPYEVFYQLWKLSYLFGRLYSDISTAYEDLVTDPRAELSSAMRILDVHGYDLDKLQGLIESPAVGRWKKYASADWFEAIEARVDATLRDFASSPEMEPRAPAGVVPDSAARVAADR